MMSDTTPETGKSLTGITKVRRLPPEFSILAVLFGLAMVFEVLGWYFVGESFLGNKQRLSIIVLQVAVTGIIAIGVTQVIITGGVDLSSGSVVGLIAMVAASLAQSASNGRAVYSFCMCPGGTVVAATSEPGRVVTNGMSQYSRNERNANAGIVVGIEPADACYRPPSSRLSRPSLSAVIRAWARFPAPSFS